MCGILGTLPASDYNLLKSALDTLTHRGPDDFGIEDIDGRISWDIDDSQYWISVPTDISPCRIKTAVTP